VKFLRAFVASEDELFRSELILGEILANTVEHAPGLVGIEIDWSGTYPIVMVSDTGPGLSRFVAQLPEDGMAENGRGLFLISTLALDVRIESAGERGTMMRIVLPIRRDLAFAANAPLVASG
jgi:anti-sigma regulatory factor (Ser/Thr protein kinase)